MRGIVCKRIGLTVMDIRIISIGDILVSGELLDEYFACDYEKCKGACCIIGDSGAPLEADEAEALERCYDDYAPLMQPAGREVVEKTGFFTIDGDGDMVTPLIGDSEECAFTHFDSDGSCFCAPERRWCEGKCSFRKPASCWLYPIRVTELSNGMKALNLHRWHICADAFAKGRRENIKVYQFLKEPLEAVFGKEFYAALCEADSKTGSLSFRK